MTMHSELGGAGVGGHQAAGLVHTMHSDPRDAAVPEVPEVPSVPGGIGIEVDPRRVRAAAEIVAEQVALLERKLADSAPALRIKPPSEDQVSVHAAEAWNAAIADGEGGYLTRVQEYLRGLQLLAAQLRAAADRYESDDSEAEDSFTANGAS